MKRIKRVLSLVFALALIFSFSLCLAPSASAVTANEDVQEAADGVFRVMAYFSEEVFYDTYLWDDYDEEYVPFYEYYGYDETGPIAMGTAFLIGYDNGQPVLLTNAHVVENEEAIKYYNEDGVTISNINLYDHFTIAVRGDVELTATVKYSSENYDFAILYVDGSLSSKTVLTLNSEEQDITTSCYALGFPGDLDTLLDDMDFTSDSVTVTQGTISNVTTISTDTASNIPVYQTSATISGGNSGGPLVNDKGEVIGINSYSYTTSEATNYYYAIRIDEVCETLDLLDIPYTPSSDSNGDATEPSEPDEEDEEDEEAVSTVVVENETAEEETEVTPEPTPEPAEETPEITSEPEPTAEPEPEPTNNTLLYIIIAGVLVVALVVVAIVIVSSKKKKETPPDPGPYQPIPPIVGGGNGGGTEDIPTGLLDSGADQATTVLGGGAGGATVCLTRESNGEKIFINKNIFRIGRDRNRVDYAITDNTAISRSHVAIVSRNGEYFIIDNNTANHTYVNEVMTPANVETPIREGDVIRLANETFRFGRV